MYINGTQKLQINNRQLRVRGQREILSQNTHTYYSQSENKLVCLCDTVLTEVDHTSHTTDYPRYLSDYR